MAFFLPVILFHGRISNLLNFQDALLLADIVVFKSLRFQTGCALKMEKMGTGN